MRISDGSSDVCYSDLLVERDIMIAAVVRDLAERHRFDEGEVAAGPGAMIEHREQLILVEPGKRDHVDLDRQSRIARRSEEHTSELQSLMRISYAVFCLKKKKQKNKTSLHHTYRPK